MVVACGGRLREINERGATLATREIEIAKRQVDTIIHYCKLCSQYWSRLFFQLRLLFRPLRSHLAALSFHTDTCRSVGYSPASVI